MRSCPIARHLTPPTFIASSVFALAPALIHLLPHPTASAASLFHYNRRYKKKKLANVKATGQTDKKPHKATIKRKTKQKNPIPQKTNKKKKFIFNKKAKTLRGLS